jgi:transcriptional regulator with XRE-family HTH domain
MFYERFERLCREHGYTPSGAVLAIGRSKNLAAKWHSTNATPSAEVLRDLAKLFGVSVDYLLGKEDNMDARQEVFDRAEMRVLFDAAKGVPASKIYEVVAMLERYKEESQNK